MQRKQTVRVHLWHGKGDLLVPAGDLVNVVRAAVHAVSKNDLDLVVETASRELMRRAELDRKSLEGLLDSKRRKALRCAKHAANVRAAQERREMRRAAYLARARAEASARAAGHPSIVTPRDWENAARHDAARLDESAAAFAHAFGI